MRGKNNMPIVSAYVADLAPAEMRGRYMGALGLSWAIALLVGPAAGILLFGFSPVALWGVCGVLGLVAALIAASLPK
jgi:MFS family permease